jgi:hypothetical protein
MKNRRRRARKLLKPFHVQSGTIAGDVVRSVSLSFLVDDDGGKGRL